jgi:hypothetical protein
MRVEQFFARTLADIGEKLRSNPGEYELLRVAGLLRPILWENLLDDAAAVAPSVEVRFRVVKPGPLPIPPEVQAEMDAAWARLHATNPEIKRVDVAVGINPNLLSGVKSQPSDEVLALTREKFLRHGFITYNDTVYTVEHLLKLAANSMGGIHWGTWNRSPEARQLGEYMSESVWFGTPMPAAMIGAIAGCTLRACQPLADELIRRGLA